MIIKEHDSWLLSWSGLFFLIVTLAMPAACGGDRAQQISARASVAEGTDFLYEEVDELEDDTAALAEYEEFNLEPYILLGTLVFKNGTAREGGLWVEDGIIQAVWAGARPDSLAGITTINTGGIILPGFIDLHNHVAYNFLPLWETEPTWENRYEWQGDPGYRREVSQPYNAAKRAGLLDQMDKYGEIRALVGGTTSILGAAPAAGAGILVRNIDQRTLGDDLMRTNVGSVYEFGCSRGRPLCPEQAEAVRRLRRQLDDGTFEAIVLHVGEGVDADSKREFEWLERNDLLRPDVIITHATGFGAQEFQKMARAGMALIWSPRSNLVLYGATTDVRAAKNAGVRIAIAPDWSPSGSDNLLGELRYAADYNRTVLNGLFSAAELVAMATSVPAELAGRGDVLGSLEPEYVADLLVLAPHADDPFESIITSDERHVRLVTVNGVPLYGWPSWLNRLGKAGDYERIRIRGRTRALDATVPPDAGVRNGDETWSAIRNKLADAYRPWGRLPKLTANDTN